MPAYTYAGTWGPVPILDTNGVPIDTATLTVYTDSGHTTKASLYTDYTKNSAASNPVVADSLGNYGFSVAPGVYYGVVTFNNVSANMNLNVLPYPLDPGVLDTVTATGTPSPGDVPQVNPDGSISWQPVSAGIVNGVTVSGIPTVGQVLTATGGAAADWQGIPSPTSISGVAVSGTPGTGQVLTATDGTDATWKTPSLSGVSISGSPSAGNILIATDSTDASWGPPTVIAGVNVTGTPSTGQVLTATDSTDADWQTPTVNGVAVSGTPSAGQVLTASSGSAASWQAVTATSIDGVTVSGTPSSGQTLTATGATTANWQNPNLSGVAVTGTPTTGQVLTATSSSAADWQAVTATTIDGVTVSGTPSSGQVLTATGASAANWQAPGFSGVTVSGTPAAGQALIATSTSAAGWQNVNTVDGVTVSGTASSGKVLTASSGTAASWQNPTATTIDGVTVTGTPSTGQALIATSSTAANWAAVSDATVNGVTVSGAPTTGQVLTATGTTAADWATPTVGGITVTGTPAVGNVLVATSTTAADWQAPTVIDGVTVTGTPASGQALIATSTTAANWQNPTVGGISVSGTPSAGQVLTATGSTAADWENVTATSLNGVTVSGTAAAGKALIATGSAAASWQTPSAIDGVNVSGTPTAGQVLTATSGVAADWQTVTATTLSGVAVSGTPSANQVLTATGSSAANWSTAPGSAITVAAAVVGDNGITDNTSYLQGLLDTMQSSGSGGTLVIPNTPGDIGITTLNVHDHCFIEGRGKQWGKNQPSGGGSPWAQGGTAFCVYNQASSAYPGGTTVKSMIKLGYNAGLMNLTVKGYSHGSNNNGTGTVYNAPVNIWVSGSGCTLHRVTWDTGQGLGILAGSNCIDSTFVDCRATSNHTGATSQYVLTCNSNTSSGDTTFTVSSGASNILPGMHVMIMGQNIPFIPPDAVVTNVSGSTITIADQSGTSGAQKGLSGNINGFSVVFFSGAAGLVSDSDTAWFGLRSITGTWISRGADTQYIGCHFSDGGSNGFPYNLVHSTSQGANYTGCTFDSGSPIAAHILRVQGALHLTGCTRLQCGLSGGTNFPSIQDVCSETQHGTHLNGVLIPTLNGTNNIHCVILYSKKVYDSATSAWVTIVGNSNAANPSDTWDDLTIEKQAVDTTTDPLGQVMPNIAMIGPSSGNPLTGATYTPFLGQGGLGRFVLATRTDTATVSSGSSTISDTSITAGDFGMPVSGTGIPSMSYVGRVTAGTSFKLVDPYGNFVNATANGTSVVVGTTSQTLRSSTPIAMNTYWPATPTAIATTALGFAGFGADTNDPTVFVPHALGNYEVEFVLGTGSLTANQTLTFQIRYGTGTPPANGTTAGSTGTVAHVNNLITKPQAVATTQNAPVYIKGMIPITSSGLNVATWFDIAAVDGGAPSDTVSIIPQYISLKGPYCTF